MLGDTSIAASRQGHSESEEGMFPTPTEGSQDGNLMFLILCWTLYFCSPTVKCWSQKEMPSHQHTATGTKAGKEEGLPA